MRGFPLSAGPVRSRAGENLSCSPGAACAVPGSLSLPLLSSQQHVQPLIWERKNPVWPSAALETQPTHLLCQSCCLQLPSDQVSGFSPALHSVGCASTGMPEHSRSSVHRNHVSAPHKPFPKAVDLLLLPSGNHRRSHPDPLGCPLQPSHPAEPLRTKPKEALLME